MFYNPSIYHDYEKLLEIISLKDLDISDSTLKTFSLIADKTEPIDKKYSWFQYDFTEEVPKIHPLENFDDIDEIRKEFPGSGAWLNFQLDKSINQIITDHFKNLISLVSNLKGFKILQISSVHDILLSPHTDDCPDTFRCLLTIECPKNQNVDLFGIEVGGVKMPIKQYDIHVFDASNVHSAWNFTDVKWKFIIIDIEKRFFNL
jgi:hypothetical protein